MVRSKELTKFIFVTGGVVSSLGKGLTCASIGALLESRGLRVTICKVDPYLNIDPGTMSPFQHGEVFVTDDGAETDLDLGHYERFTNGKTCKLNNFTAGQVYDQVIRNERKGDYLGGTVQVIPHVTDEIKRRIHACGQGYEICIAEIGGTVGDIEGLPFLEAIRQFSSDVGKERVLYIHLTLVPYIPTTEEMKTKPTQHSVKELTSLGIQPDVIVLRTDRVLDFESKKKISLFCNVHDSSVITALDVDNIYDLPLILNSEGLDVQVCEKLNIWTGAPNLQPWKFFSSMICNPPEGSVSIVMVGKYVTLKESYKSLYEALVHAGVRNGVEVNIDYVDSSGVKSLEQLGRSFNQCDAILVPGGFGKRGSEGKIFSIEFARTRDIPFLGICLGMQMAVVEFARNVANLSDAASAEFNPNSLCKVIDLMREQKDVDLKGGSMRLGAWPCKLKDGTLARSIYGVESISERHRHRWEFNNSYRSLLESAGLLCSGLSPDERFVEIIEIPTHRWFVGVQFHPEFLSKPLAPHPLFSSYIKAAMAFRNAREPSGVETAIVVDEETTTH